MSAGVVLLVACIVGVVFWLGSDRKVDVAPPLVSDAIEQRELQLLSTPLVDLSKTREVIQDNAPRKPSTDGAWPASILVIDALGEPVANAKVDLSAAQKGPALHTVFTDSLGLATLMVSADRAFVRAYHQDVGRSIAVDAVDIVAQGGLVTRLMLARPASMTASVIDQQAQPVASQLVRLVDTARGRFYGTPTFAPRTVTTDIHGRFEFEALVGERVTMGRDPRTAFVAHEGGDVVSRRPEVLDSVDDALEWFCGVSWDPDRLKNFGRDYFGHIRTKRDLTPFWIEVLMPGAVAVPDAKLYWVGPNQEVPKKFYPQARDGHRYRLHAFEVRREPMQLLVRGRDGYSRTLMVDKGALPTSVVAVLQPPGDIQIKVLHRGQRARGVHTELTSWGKRATAHLDAEGIARYAMVHHGLMNVRVMRGTEILVTRQVHVPSLGTALAIVHVDLSR
ncbi:MAG: hypothetical protein ACI85K_002317 [Hyphomicrobiaceae bacterium]|jgi:hypothetical protein